MFEEKLLVGIAAFASSTAVLAVLFVVPSLYATINEVHDYVQDGVQVSENPLDPLRPSAWRQTPPGRR